MARMSVKERIERFAEEYGYSFRDDYSGRFMFGRRCIGVSGKGDLKMDLFEFLVDDGLSVSRTRQIIILNLFFIKAKIQLFFVSQNYIKEIIF